jgi:putative transposase
MSAPDRRRLIDRKGVALSIRRQCELLGIARTGLYRSASAANGNDLALTRRIDVPRLASNDDDAAGGGLCHQPQAGAAADAQDAHCRARPEAADEKPASGHKIFPYLLGTLAINRANQVWCADIPYIPIGRGFLYLVAIMD